MRWVSFSAWGIQTWPFASLEANFVHNRLESDLIQTWIRFEKVLQTEIRLNTLKILCWQQQNMSKRHSSLDSRITLKKKWVKDMQRYQIFESHSSLNAAILIIMVTKWNLLLLPLCHIQYSSNNYKLTQIYVIPDWKMCFFPPLCLLLPRDPMNQHVPTHLK